MKTWGVTTGWLLTKQGNNFSCYLWPYVLSLITKLSRTLITSHPGRTVECLCQTLDFLEALSQDPSENVRMRAVTASNACISHFITIKTGDEDTGEGWSLRTLVRVEFEGYAVKGISLDRFPLGNHISTKSVKTYPNHYIPYHIISLPCSFLLRVCSIWSLSA